MPLTQFPMWSKHPIQFRYVPMLGLEPEGDCNWQPLDSRLDLNIDETETWQKGLCSTFWLTSCYTDPCDCQINSVSVLQYVHVVRLCHSVLDPTWDPSQSNLMSTQKLQDTLNQQGQKCNIKEHLFKRKLLRLICSDYFLILWWHFDITNQKLLS